MIENSIANQSILFCLIYFYRNNNRNSENSLIIFHKFNFNNYSMIPGDNVPFFKKETNLQVSNQKIYSIVNII